MNPKRLLRLAWIAALLFLILSGGRPLILGFGLIGVVLLLVLVFPGSTFSRVMRSHHGPSLSAGTMSRGECLRSAGSFLVVVIMSLGSIYLIDTVATHLGVYPGDVPELQVLLFMYVIFLGIGVIGALYLLVRAPFRPKDTGSPD
jgi:hypothetical protein